MEAPGCWLVHWKGQHIDPGRNESLGEDLSRWETCTLLAGSLNRALPNSSLTEQMFIEYVQQAEHDGKKLSRHSGSC